MSCTPIICSFYWCTCRIFHPWFEYIVFLSAFLWDLSFSKLPPTTPPNLQIILERLSAVAFAASDHHNFSQNRAAKTLCLLRRREKPAHNNGPWDDLEFGHGSGPIGIWIWQMNAIYRAVRSKKRCSRRRYGAARGWSEIKTAISANWIIHTDKWSLHYRHVLGANRKGIRRLGLGTLEALKRLAAAAGGSSKKMTSKQAVGEILGSSNRYKRRTSNFLLTPSRYTSIYKGPNKQLTKEDAIFGEENTVAFAGRNTKHEAWKYNNTNWTEPTIKPPSSLKNTRGC